MWTNKYKEDALKWRKQEERLEVEMAAKEYKLSYKVYLSGVTKPLVVERVCEGKRLWDYWCEEYYAVTAKALLQDFVDTFDGSFESGFRFEGALYPPHRIDKVEFGEIEEVSTFRKKEETDLEVVQ
tara:strand:+ start:2675 stop:3052 length:378 start_codon:yes stop_codon:yes gene_type:complete